jgi:diaminohydroxyphosphoribosylaminopyrimidine deaminase/5-amino-6-(5-phosphoribosylamino)uracil reductase
MRLSFKLLMIGLENNRILFMNENVKFMKEAVSLALKGKNMVYPNPMVGALIVKDNKVIGRGWHRCFGSNHAEVNAISDAGKDLKGADLYVTLEPCNTYGKRPPCSKAIIETGIKRVFYGSADPLVKGGSAKLLESKGIEVNGGICSKETDKLIKDYLLHLKVKPKVSIKAAMTLDGKIASKDYDSKWITSQKSRDFVHSLRTKYDAVLIGSNTAIVDNPHLTSHKKGKNPIRVAILSKLNLNKNAYLLNDEAPSIIFYNEEIKSIPIYYFRENVLLAPINIKELKKDFSLVINKLKTFGIRTILIEGGSEIIASALFAKAVDDLYLFIAPKIIGGKNAVSVVGGAGFSKIQDALSVKELKVQKIDKDLLITGKLK